MPINITDADIIGKNVQFYWDEWPRYGAPQYLTGIITALTANFVVFTVGTVVYWVPLHSKYYLQIL